MSDYNKLERPVYNETDPVNLTFGLTLQQIIDVVSYFSSMSWNKTILHNIWFYVYIMEGEGVAKKWIFNEKSVLSWK